MTETVILRLSCASGWTPCTFWVCPPVTGEIIPVNLLTQKQSAESVGLCYFRECCHWHWYWESWIYIPQSRGFSLWHWLCSRHEKPIKMCSRKQKIKNKKSLRNDVGSIRTKLENYELILKLRNCVSFNKLFLLFWYTIPRKWIKTKKERQKQLERKMVTRQRNVEAACSDSLCLKI